MRISIVNAVTSVTATSEDANYPAANLLRPDQPFIPWKATGTGDQTLSVTLTQASKLIVLVRANFITATIAGVPATIQRNVVNWRYQHAILLSSPVSSFSVVIPSQSPTEDSVLKLGGIWAGPVEVPPRDLLYDVGMDTIPAWVDIKPDHNGWVERLTLGQPRGTLSAQRIGRIVRATPGLNDELRAWAEIDRKCWEADKFAVFLNAGDPSLALIARRSGSLAWTRNRFNIVEGHMDLEEVIQ
jgi:hypothetical protein